MCQVLSPRDKVSAAAETTNQHEQVPSRSTNYTVMYSEDENGLPRLRGLRADMDEQEC